MRWDGLPTHPLMRASGRCTKSSVKPSTIQRCGDDTPGLDMGVRGPERAMLSVAQTMSEDSIMFWTSPVVDTLTGVLNREPFNGRSMTMHCIGQPLA